jgi:hypothetical protein
MGRPLKRVFVYGACRAEMPLRTEATSECAAAGATSASHRFRHGSFVFCSVDLDRVLLGFFDLGQRQFEHAVFQVGACF